nr:MAG TPA: hypothetical protein [Caudoviricetes sp.]
MTYGTITEYYGTLDANQKPMLTWVTRGRA